MRKRTLLCALGLAMLLSACSKGVLGDLDHPEDGARKMEILQAVQLDDITGQNPMLNSGVYRDSVYYLSDNGKEMRLNFLSMEDMSLQRSISVPKGKGPGEMMHAMRVSVGDEKIIIFESDTLKFLIYGHDGKYLEECIMDPAKGIPFFHSQTPDGIVYSGMLRTRVGLASIRDDYSIEVTRNIEYDNVLKGLEEMEESGMRTALPLYDGGEIFLSETNDSYSLSALDMELKETKRYFDISGKHIAIGLGVDENSIYVPAPFDFDKARRTGSMKSDLIVSVLERKSGRHLYNLKSDVDSVEGVISVLGVSRGRIAMLVLDEKNDIGRMLGKEKPGSTTWLMVIR